MKTKLAALCLLATWTLQAQTALQKTITYNAAVDSMSIRLVKGIKDAIDTKTTTKDRALPVARACESVILASREISAITRSAKEANWAVDGPRIRAFALAMPRVPSVGHEKIDVLSQVVNEAVALLKSVK